MFNRSQALRDFRFSIAIAETLMKNEEKFKDPAPPNSRKIVLGLRGGATVLMVAAFENFLKELVEEKLDNLKGHPKYNPKKLPNDLVSHNCSQTFKETIKNSGNVSDPMDRITIFQQAALAITKEEVDTRLFSYLAESNPNSKKVRNLFIKLGISDIFITIKPKFDKKWKNATTPTFIPEKLDSIIERRHIVAHTANAMKITRVDLSDSVRFLKILADLCDEELYYHFSKFIK